eukprot:SM001480S01074  [mRNA]  locus=s1480:533:2027:- [translate_table: standard]
MQPPSLPLLPSSLSPSNQLINPATRGSRHHRCREKQRNEATRLAAVNVKLVAANKDLADENARLRGQVAELLADNHTLRKGAAAAAHKETALAHAFLQPEGLQLVTQPLLQPLQPCQAAVTPMAAAAVPTAAPTTDASSKKIPDAIVAPGLPTAASSSLDPELVEQSVSGLLVVAEELLAEFLARATGSGGGFSDLACLQVAQGVAVPAQGCRGEGGSAAVRAAGLVGLAPAKVPAKMVATWVHLLASPPERSC